jgi:hypothetical protein
MHLNGNLYMCDGQLDYYDAVDIYGYDTATIDVNIIGSDYLKYNVATGYGYFDGNESLVDNSDGNVPTKADFSLPPTSNANVFHINDDLIQVHDHATAQVTFYMLTFNDRKYRKDPLYNLQYASPYMNFSIPNRPSIPYNPEVRGPYDAALEFYTPERMYMLRGEQLWKVQDKYFDADHCEHEVLTLSQPYIRDIIYDIKTGKPKSMLGYYPYIIYDPHSPNGSFSKWIDIPFTSSFTSIRLRRTAYEMKGIINIQGDYYWCVLKFNAIVNGIVNDYTIESFEPTDPETTQNVALIETIPYNPELTILS